MSRSIESQIRQLSSKKEHVLWAEIFMNQPKIPNVDQRNPLNPILTLAQSIDCPSYQDKQLKSLLSTGHSETDAENILISFFGLNAMVPMTHLEIAHQACELDLSKFKEKELQPLVSIVERTLIYSAVNFTDELAMAIRGTPSNHLPSVFWSYLPFIIQFFVQVYDKAFHEFTILIQSLLLPILSQLGQIVSLDEDSFVLRAVIAIIPILLKCAARQKGGKDFISFVNSFISVAIVKQSNLKAMYPAFEAYAESSFCSQDFCNQFMSVFDRNPPPIYFSTGLKCLPPTSKGVSFIHWTANTFPLSFLNFPTEACKDQLTEKTFTTPVKIIDVKEYAKVIVPFGNLECPTALNAITELSQLNEYLPTYAKRIDDPTSFLYSLFEVLQNTTQFPQRQTLLAISVVLVSYIIEGRPLDESPIFQELFDPYLFTISPEQITSRPTALFVKQMRKFTMHLCSNVYDKHYARMSIFNGIDKTASPQSIITLLPFLQRLAFSDRRQFPQIFSSIRLFSTLCHMIDEYPNTEFGHKLFDFLQLITLFEPKALINSSFCSTLTVLICNPLYTDTTLELFSRTLQDSDTPTTVTVLLNLAPMIAHSTSMDVSTRIVKMMNRFLSTVESPLIEQLLKTGLLETVASIPMVLKTNESMINTLDFLTAAFTKYPSLKSFISNKSSAIVRDLLKALAQVKITKEILDSLTSMMMCRRAEYGEDGEIINQYAVKLFLNVPGFETQVYVYLRQLVERNFANCYQCSQGDSLLQAIQKLDGTPTDELVDFIKEMSTHFASPIATAALFKVMKGHCSMKWVSTILDWLVKISQNPPEVPEVIIHSSGIEGALVPPLPKQWAFEAQICAPITSEVFTIFSLDRMVVFYLDHRKFYLALIVRGTKTVIDLKAELPPSKWTRVRFEINSDTVTLYMDGVQKCIAPALIPKATSITIGICGDIGSASIESLSGEKELVFDFENADEGKVPLIYREPNVKYGQFVGTLIRGSCSIVRTFENESSWRSFMLLLSSFKEADSTYNRLLFIMNGLYKVSPASRSAFTASGGFTLLGQTLGHVPPNDETVFAMRELFSITEERVPMIVNIWLNYDIWLNLPVDRQKDFFFNGLPSLYLQYDGDFYEAFATRQIFSDFVEIVAKRPDLLDPIWTIASDLLTKGQSVQIAYELLTTLAEDVCRELNVRILDFLIGAIPVSPEFYSKALAQFSFFGPFLAIINKCDVEVKNMIIQCIALAGKLCEPELFSQIMTSLVAQISCTPEEARTLYKTCYFITFDTNDIGGIKVPEFLPLLSFMTSRGDVDMSEREKIAISISGDFQASSAIARIKLWPFWVINACDPDGIIPALIGIMKNQIVEGKIKPVEDLFAALRCISEIQHYDFGFIRSKIMMAVFGCWPRQNQYMLIPFAVSAIMIKQPGSSTALDASIDIHQLYDIEEVPAYYEMRIDENGKWIDEKLADLTINAIFQLGPKNITFNENASIHGVSLLACLISLKMRFGKVDAEIFCKFDEMLRSIDVSAEDAHTAAAMLVVAPGQDESRKQKLLEIFNVFDDDDDSCEYQKFIFEAMLQNMASQMLAPKAE